MAQRRSPLRRPARHGTRAIAILGLGHTLSTTVGGWVIAFWLVVYSVGVGCERTRSQADPRRRPAAPEQPGVGRSTARQIGSALGTAVLGTVCS
jgi:hypothetical protein